MTEQRLGTPEVGARIRTPHPASCLSPNVKGVPHEIWEAPFDYRGDTISHRGTVGALLATDPQPVGSQEGFSCLPFLLPVPSPGPPSSQSSGGGLTVALPPLILSTQLLSLLGPSFCSLAQLSNTELLRETEAQRGLRGSLVHPASSGPAQALAYILLKRELDCSALSTRHAQPQPSSCPWAPSEASGVRDQLVVGAEERQWGGRGGQGSLRTHSRLDQPNTRVLSQYILRA